MRFWNKHTDMPRGKQFGFLFTEKADPSTLAKTIAHELGHGYFQLKHPFEMGLSQQERQEALMSYGDGIAFNKYEWDLMHDAGIVTGLFESDTSGQFKMSIHKRITENAFIKSGLSTGWLYIFKNDILQGVSFIADIVGGFSDYHFDGRRDYNEVQKTWESLTSALNDKINDLGIINKTIGGVDAILFGKLIHTVQDFYSHSNYVEIYIEYYKEKNKGAMPLSVPMYDVRFGGTSNADFKALLQGKLKTGEFNLLDNEFWDINLTGDNHTGVDSHKAINKDEANTPAGKLAEQVATEHITKILNQIKENK